MWQQTIRNEAFKKLDVRLEPVICNRSQLNYYFLRKLEMGDAKQDSLPPTPHCSTPRKQFLRAGDGGLWE